MNHAERMVEKAGGVEAVAEALNITIYAVYAWQRQNYIPIKKARAVAELAGVKPEIVAKREIP